MYLGYLMACSKATGFWGQGSRNLGSWGRWSCPEAGKVAGPAVPWRGAHSCSATGSGHIWQHIWHVAAAGGGEGCVPWLPPPQACNSSAGCGVTAGKGDERANRGGVPRLWG